MLNRVYQKKFIKDIERAKKRGKDINKLSTVIDILLEEKILHAKYKNHKLHGEYKGYWECHIEPNWLLVYKKVSKDLILARTGTHSDLF
ncbi:damage-inducible protein [candidate division TM6 bacterium RIFCSPHIGHO2_12_FULL_32_22]|nr:MAG: damage-inducible protein [candidate division TM6 bacterium RIFCSPHIGHO2_12_FULL_32_22]